MYVVLVYDIKTIDEYARVSNWVFKTCKKFLTHIQNSVFEGDLNKTQFMNLKLQLKNYLRPKIDSCIIFKSNNNKWLSKEFLISEEDKTLNIL
mgnify:CR=1 FL=1